jgi:hypothetical protein
MQSKYILNVHSILPHQLLNDLLQKVAVNWLAANQSYLSQYEMEAAGRLWYSP